MARKQAKEGWTEERRERFKATMAAKRQTATVTPTANGSGVARITVDGKAYEIDEALAIYTAVSKLKHAAA